MSLLEALLTEGFRDPRDIHIAVRADGQRGSGTMADPYDGGTRMEPVGQSSSAMLTCNRKEFVVGTPFAHGLLSSDIGSNIEIANNRGATGPSEALFSGTFTLKAIVSPIHFLLETSSVPAGPPAVESSAYPTLITTDYPSHSGNQNALPAIARIYWPVAKVTTAQPHGLPSFGAVNLADITSPYAGDHVALGPDATGQVFYVRLSALPGADITTPLGCTVSRILHRFDDVMRGAPANSVIHLGPGTFKTRGGASIYIANPSDYANLHVGYVLRPAQRLVGSGLGATTLKLVLPVDEINQTTAVPTFLNSSSPHVDHAEVADLTIDCNAPGHVAPYGVFPAPVTCGAVGLGGSFITLRRVRAIQFCTQGRSECFVLGLGPGAGGSAPVFNVIDDCIVEQPGENNTHETTLLFNSGDVYGNGRSPIVRHNYIDARYANGVSSEPLWIDKIEYGATDTEAVVTTKRDHHRTASNNVLLSNVRKKLYDSMGNQIGEEESVFNRAFAITGVPAANQFKILKPAGAPPSADLSYESPYDNIRAYIGVDFHGPAALSGTGCVTEGIVALDCVTCFYSDTGSSRDVVVRDNYYCNAGYGVYLNFPPAVFDAFRGASAIVPENASEDPGYKHGVFTSIQPHGLSVTNPLTKVTIRDAGVSGPDANNRYHGTDLEVVAIRGSSPSRQFVYRLANQSAVLPADNCAGRPVFATAISISSLAYDKDTQRVDVTTGTSHGLEDGDFVTIFATSEAKFHGFSGPIIKDASNSFHFTRDLGISDLSGSGGSLDRQVGAGVVRNGSVATVTTVSPHGYFFGQVFKIQGAYVNGEGDTRNRFYGVVTVKSHTDRSFSYDLKQLPSGIPDPDPTGSVISPTGPVAYAAHWDLRYFVLENNQCDLYGTDVNTAIWPRGATMFGLRQEDIPPYLFPNLIYRGNTIRHINQVIPVGTDQPTYGIYATTVGGGIVEQNIVDVSPDRPLTYQFFGRVAHLENRTSGGAPLHGTKLNPDQTTESIDDLETRVQDALTIALL